MSYIDIQALNNEMHDIHIVHASCLFWRMRCLSHRLIAFGWEKSVTHLSAIEAIVLASIVPPVMHDELARAAYEIADDRWKAFLRSQVPHLVEEAVPA